MNEELARLEAEILAEAIRNSSKAIENEHVVRILSKRSKAQLKLTFDRYKAKYGTSIDEVDIPFPNSDPSLWIIV